MKIKYNQDNLALLYIWRIGGPIEFQDNNRAFEYWNNVRFNIEPFPPSPDFKNLDVRKGLPFPDNSFDAIYAYHISEHLTWDENIQFNKELLRVLKPKGICRLSTPDLHQKASNYLEMIQDYRKNPSEESRKKYYWSVYALIDQLARIKSGGEMGRALSTGQFDKENVQNIHGDVFRHFYADDMILKPLFRRNTTYFIYAVLRKIHHLFTRNKPDRFIENERFYFDDITYKQILEESGFSDVTIANYKKSRIPRWDKYQLDKSEFGDYPMEPSVFAEGVKIG